MDTNQVGLILTGLSLLVGLASLLFPDEVRGLKLSVRVLGIVGLLVGLALIVVAARGGGGPGSQAQSTTTGPSGTALDPTTTGVPGPSSTGAPEGSSTASVRWKARIRVPQAFYVNFDDTEPRVGASVADPDMYSSTGREDITASFYTYGSAGSAPDAAPSFAGCRAAVETAALETTFEIDPGQGFCIRTRPDSGDPHIAHAKVVAIDRRTGAVSLDVTVWQEGAAAPVTTAAQGSVRWKETIRIPQAFYVNFDDTEPRVGSSVSDPDMYSSTGRDDTTAQFYTYGSVGSAPASAPSFAGCRGAVETAALETTFEIEPGEGFCIRTRPDTGAPHIAHAKVAAIDRRSGAVTLDVTVWRQEP